VTVSSAQPVKALTVARAYKGPDDLVGRRCPTHGSYVTRVDARPGCPKCRKNELARAAWVAKTMTCDACGTELRTAAKYCNWCDPTFDLEAALAAQDALTEGTR
jgi:hypothetical protein